MPKRSDKQQRDTSPVRCVWGLLCSMSSIDQQRNNISLFNVIDELHLPADAFKANEKRRILFEHEIVTLWRKTMDTEIDDRTLRFDIGVSLFDPNGAVSKRMLKGWRRATSSR